MKRIALLLSFLILEGHSVENNNFLRNAEYVVENLVNGTRRVTGAIVEAVGTVAKTAGTIVTIGGMGFSGYTAYQNYPSGCLLGAKILSSGAAFLTSGKSGFFCNSTLTSDPYVNMQLNNACESAAAYGYCYDSNGSLEPIIQGFSFAIVGSVLWAGGGIIKNVGNWIKPKNR